MAATVAGCASESYYGPSNSYGYQRPQAYTNYYSSPGDYYAPSAYRTTSYSYGYAPPPSYPQRGGYDGYWDYQRNYRGSRPAPEL